MTKDKSLTFSLPLKQSYIDRFRNAIRKDRAEWYFRFRHAGYRLLLSYSFFVSAKRIAKQKSILLPIIGLYYCYFHLVAALMCVDPLLTYEQLPRFPLDHYRAKRDGIENFMKKRGTDPKKVKLLSHKRVSNYVEGANRKGILSEDFISGFSEAKSLRFSVNYAPDYFGYLEIDKLFDSLIKQTQKGLDEANLLIFTLNRDYIQTCDRHELFWTPQDFLDSFIGDAIGEDFADNYLNKKESKQVFSILDNAAPYGKCVICGKMTQSQLVGGKPLLRYVCSDKCMDKLEAKDGNDKEATEKRVDKKAKES